MSAANPVKGPAPMNLVKMAAKPAEPFDVKIMEKAVGMLNHLALHSRPDITHTVNILSHYSNKPTVCHWNIVKHLLRYLHGTTNVGIMYSKTSKPNKHLTGWADADYANCTDMRKSTTGFVITLYGNPVHWMIKKQTVVAQSTTEEEFIAMNHCAKQIRWLSGLIISLGVAIPKPVIFNNNAGANFISKEAQLNPNSKHIEVRYQYLRDLVSKSLLSIKQVPSSNMIADILNKPLGHIKVSSARDQLRLRTTEFSRSVSAGTQQSPPKRHSTRAASPVDMQLPPVVSASVSNGSSRLCSPPSSVEPSHSRLLFPVKLNPLVPCSRQIHRLSSPCQTRSFSSPLGQSGGA